jgi:tetratricopeptide (TPR) repeat protein
VWRSAWLKLALVPLLIVAGLRETRAVTLRTLDQLPVEVLEAAERVRPLVRPGERVFARKPHFAWYAGLTPVALPLTEDLGEWGRLAQQEDVRWLYFSWPEAQLRNAFEWLLDSTSAAPGLTVRAATSHWPAVVYEIDTRFGDPPAWAGNDTLEAVHRARARAQLNPKDAETRVFLAMHEFSLGRHEVAQRWIDELLAIGPRDPDVLLLAAENRLQLRDPAGALSYYERADRVRPGTAEVRIGFGWVAAMQGDEVKAARFWAPVADASSDPVTLQRMMIAFARTQDATAYAVAQRKLAELGGAR